MNQNDVFIILYLSLFVTMIIWTVYFAKHLNNAFDFSSLNIILLKVIYGSINVSPTISKVSKHNYIRSGI